MNHIYYNGVALNQLETLAYTKKSVYNGLDYLYTTHRLRVRATFNPTTQLEGYPQEANQWVPGSDPGKLTNPSAREPLVGPSVQSFYVPLNGTPFRANRPGAYTAQVIQHQLMSPRGRFVWVQDGVRVLISPLPGYLTDSANGPFPVECKVTPMGSKTFLVEWEFETHLSECPRFTSQPHPILSNTWSMSHEVDQDYYVVRKCEGKTVLDAQAVRGSPLDPNGDRPDLADSLRSALFFPIPEGFKRQAIRVKLLEDALTLVWSYEDREMPFTFVATGITPHVTRIECIQRVENTPFNPTKALISDVPIIKGLVPFIDYFNITRDMIPSWINGMLNGGQLGGPLRGPSWLDSIRMSLATSTHTIQVRVWGDRDSYRIDLEEVAREVIKQRRKNLATLVAGLIPTGTVCTHDVAGSFVEGVDTYLGPALINSTTSDPLPTQMVSTVDSFPGENTDGVLQWDNLNAAAWPMPTANHTRGTYLEYLVGQFLTTPCSTLANTPPRVLSPIPMPPVGTPPPLPPPSQPPPSAPSNPPPDIGPPVIGPRP